MSSRNCDTCLLRYRCDEQLEFFCKNHDLCRYEKDKTKPVLRIKLEERQSGYEAIAKYIKRYWEHNGQDTIIVSMKISFNDKDYETVRAVAYPMSVDDVEFLHDWWEGQTFIKLLGIRSINLINISDGIYTEE